MHALIRKSREERQYYKVIEVILSRSSEMLQDNLLWTNADVFDINKINSDYQKQHETKVFDRPITRVSTQPEDLDKTIHSHHNKITLVYKSTNTITAQNTVPSTNRKLGQVAGTVIQIEEDAIICEIELHKKNFMNIRLPKSFFSETLFIGYPFFLSMDQSSGFRTPRITGRPLSDHFRTENLALLDSLIDGL